MVVTGARRVLPFALPGGWILGVLLWDARDPGGTPLLPLLAAAPALACAATGRRLCVVLGGAVCTLLLLLPAGAGGQGKPADRLVACATLLAVAAAGYVTAGRRRLLLRELERSRTIATAVQDALLGPLPARVGPLAVEAAHVSATRGAVIGGDLYDAVETEHGVRVVMGDVRGHGLAAVGTVSALLGCFREAAHEAETLEALLRRMERALVRAGPRTSSPHREPGTEECEHFATLLLAEIRSDGVVELRNCGHPWPWLLPGRAGEAEPVSGSVPLPPLGSFPLPGLLPSPVRLRLGPGDTLFLHTDGAQDVRGRRGRAFPLHEELLRSSSGPGTVPSVRAALEAHTGGRFSDDVALLGLAWPSAAAPARGGRAGPLPAAAGGRQP